MTAHLLHQLLMMDVVYNNPATILGKPWYKIRIWVSFTFLEPVGRLSHDVS
jgi:hypothetical protein